jgi:2-oxoisovalerate dehydrogenase E2 component (dihydrolipoyl transacylase)
LYPNDNTKTDTDAKSTPTNIETATLASDKTNGYHGESSSVTRTSSTVIDIPTEQQQDSRESIINFAMEERNEDSLTIPKPTGGSSNSIAQASPAVRRIAREYGISHEVFSTMIQGTGPNQRILKSDVLSYVKNSSTNHGMRHGNAPSDDKKVEGATRTENPQKESTNADTKDKVITLRGYTRHMISTMTTSLQIPHMCFGDEVIMNNIMTIRQQINDSLFAAAPPGSDKNSEDETTAGIQKTKISVLALLIKAVSCAMMDYPIINSIQMMDNDTNQSVTNGTILQKHDHNFGIAIDTMSRGLVVPVLHQCQNKSILTIQKDIDHLKQLAYTNQLQMEHFADLTFTISNIGSIGSGMFLQPVIVPPTLAMGAFGYTKTVPRFRSTYPVQTGSIISSSSSTTTVQEIYEAQVMNVTWAGDHRFLDGATIGRFHNRFRYYVEEQPMMLLLK